MGWSSSGPPGRASSAAAARGLTVSLSAVEQLVQDVAGVGIAALGLLSAGELEKAGQLLPRPQSALRDAEQTRDRDRGVALTEQPRRPMVRRARGETFTESDAYSLARLSAPGPRFTA